MDMYSREEQFDTGYRDLNDGYPNRNSKVELEPELHEYDYNRNSSKYELNNKPQSG